jgi:hypothetical protein
MDDEMVNELDASEQEHAVHDHEPDEADEDELEYQDEHRDEREQVVRDAIARNSRLALRCCL